MSMNPNSDLAAPGGPSTRYARPGDIVVDQALPTLDKHRLLVEWEEDIRSRLVASEEGMTGSPHDVTLADVLAAIAALPMDAPARPETPSKA